jgi:hypothetical protein
MADDDGTRYRAVLELSRITRLKGGGDAALPTGLPVESWRAWRPPDAWAEHADAPRCAKRLANQLTNRRSITVVFEDVLEQR